MKYLLLLPTMLTISACVSNTYEDNFISSSPYYKEQLSSIDNGKTAVLLESNDIDTDLAGKLNNDYKVLGYNEFEDEIKSRQLAIKFGTKIGASEVLFSRTYVGTRYKNPEYAAKTKFKTGSINQHLENEDYRKYERVKIYKYRVVFLTN